MKKNGEWQSLSGERARRGDKFGVIHSAIRSHVSLEHVSWHLFLVRMGLQERKQAYFEDDGGGKSSSKLTAGLN